MQNFLNQITITQLKGVGPKTAARLEKLGIHTAQDLVFHLPIRYEDRTTITPIKSLRIGATAVVVGTITATEVVQHGRRMFLCQLADQSGFLKLRFFNFARQKLQFIIKPGTRVYCYGEVHYFGTGLEMVHPEIKVLASEAAPPLENTLTPVYPLTEGLPQFALRKLTDQVLKIFAKHIAVAELLPPEILTALQLPSFVEALLHLHHPPKNTDLKALELRTHPWRDRLIFEELLAQHLSLLQLRAQTQVHQAPKIICNTQMQTQFMAKLPFKLTAAQERVLQEIAQDLQQVQPMQRLLQGDVGCGKTVVAALAILQTINNGYQAAIMAPTEILAEQHWQNIGVWLQPFGVKLGFISGKIQGKARKEIYAAIANGSVQVVIGTHAIFQEQLQFVNLALVIIDEQHRFGVHQRLALREKGCKDGQYPHQLIMTATPIPRTLAMTLYADLDLSIIDELPAGRVPIKTITVVNSRRAEVLARVRANCKLGKQAYWVCPLIEESEVLQCQAAETTAKELTLNLSELHVGLIHGRMKDQQKVAVMEQFKAGKIDLLVATTVIEVGVDVPNASLMIIENAERLGLVQLHQLRGRIGRGSQESHCVLLYQLPLSSNAQERLQFLRTTNDGFLIARKDLAMRGPGEVLGVKQTGVLNLRIADLLLDQLLLPKVQQLAKIILHQYPQYVVALIQRWFGDNTKYGAV